MFLPKQAKRVFKGVLFDIYQWPQKLFNGKTATFEVSQRLDAVVLLATAKNKIVVLKQRQPGTKWFYSLPSGRMDKKGETPKNAALRELLEETGMKPENISVWKTYKYSGKIRNSVFVFLAQNCTKVAKQSLDGGEKILVKLFKFDDFLKLTDNAFADFGSLTEDLLKARIHKNLKKALKEQIFGKMSRLPKNGTLANKSIF